MDLNYDDVLEINCEYLHKILLITKKYHKMINTIMGLIYYNDDSDLLSDELAPFKKIPVFVLFTNEIEGAETVPS